VLLLAGCPSPVGNDEGGSNAENGGGNAGVSTVDTPTITPSSGTFFQSVDVELSSDWQGAQIYYTLDGSEPEIGSNYYSISPITLGPGTTTVRARAWDSAGEAQTSEIAEATFTVNPGIVVTNGNSTGDGSLRRALSHAEDGTEIRFDGDYTITVPEFISGTDPGRTDGFSITNDVIINGVGFEVTLVGRLYHRIVTIDGSSNATLKNLTLRDGNQTAQGGDKGGAIMVATGASLTAENVSFRSNRASVNGGAIWLQSDSAATIEDSQFESNDATQGGAIYVGNASELTVRNTVFSQNATDASLGGGGALNGGAVIFANSGTGRIESSSFEQNESEKWGGAIAINGGSSVDIVNSAFLRNRAGVIENDNGNYGGGAINIASNSTARVGGSYFERNTAFAASYSSRTGGAIRNQGTLLSYGNTYNGNVSDSQGSAIYAGSNADSLVVSSSSFAGNATEDTGAGGTVYAGAATNVIQYSSFAYNGFGSSGLGVYVPDTNNTAELHYSAFTDGGISPSTFDVITTVFDPSALQQPEVSNENPAFAQLPDPGNDNTFGQADDSYGDLSPAAGSPLIGGGNASRLLNDVLDVDGDGDVGESEPFDAAGAPRVIGTMDVGAYEFVN
jgi:predicted outer membrane repeat protein